MNYIYYIIVYIIYYYIIVYIIYYYICIMHSYVSVYVTQLNTEYTYTDIFRGVARVSAAWGGFFICCPSSYP